MKNKHRGSDFDDFLKEENIYDEVDEAAIKRVLVLQLEKELKRNHITKKELAEKMNTSRSEVDRLIDPDNCSLTLSTLTKAAKALGKKLEIKLI